jgi:hypothetical protein
VSEDTFDRHVRPAIKFVEVAPAMCRWTRAELERWIARHHREGAGCAATSGSSRSRPAHPTGTRSSTSPAAATSRSGDRQVQRTKERLKSARARSGSRQCARAGKPIPEDAAPLARVTVEDAAAEFLTHLERQAHEHREQYVKRYEADLNLYVIRKTDDEIAEARAAGKEPWQPPWTYVDEITTAAWEEEKLPLHKANGGPLGARSIAHLTNTLRHLLRFCADPRRRYIEIVPELKLAGEPAHQEGAAEAARVHGGRAREVPPKLVYSYAPKVTPARAGRRRTRRAPRAGSTRLLHFSLLRRGEALGADARAGSTAGARSSRSRPSTRRAARRRDPAAPARERALVEQIRRAAS